jgi:hypothetical protein
MPMPMFGGGPGPMAGDMMPGGPGMPPFGGPPPASMRALDQLSAAPPGKGEQEMLQECSMNLKVASSRVILRSPRAAQEVAKAAQAVDRALELLDEEKSTQVNVPPDLMASLTPAPMGGPQSPGGGSPMGMY